MKKLTVKHLEGAKRMLVKWTELELENLRTARKNNVSATFLIENKKDFFLPNRTDNAISNKYKSIK